MGDPIKNKNKTIGNQSIKNKIHNIRTSMPGRGIDMPIVVVVDEIVA